MLTQKIVSKVLLLAVVLSPLSRASAESLDLGQFLKEVGANSLVLQKTKAASDSADARHMGSYAGFLPTLQGSVGYLMDKKYMFLDVNLNGVPISIPQVVPTTLYTLQAGISLFDGFSSVRRYQATDAGRDAAHKEYNWAEFSVGRQATLGFYKALSSKVLKDVAEQNLKSIRDHLKDSQELKRAGVGTTYDVLRVEVQISEAESEAMNAQDNVEISQLKLGEAIGRDTEDRLPTGNLPVLDAKLIEALKTPDPRERTDIQAMDDRVHSAQYMAKAADAHWYPHLTLVGQAQYYNNLNDRFDDSNGFRNAYFTSLNLSWNFFDGFASSSAANVAKQEALIQDKNLDVARIKARQDVEVWKKKYRYFCNIYKSRINDVDRSTEAVRLAKEGRRAGTRTSTELLDAETDLFHARAGVVNAQIGAIEALINLELATGQQLYNFN